MMLKSTFSAWIRLLLLLSAFARGQHPTCQKAADDYCAKNCNMKKSCRKPTVARYADNAKSDGKKWRCYSSDALDEFSRDYVGGDCYCTRDSQIVDILSKCDEEYATVFKRSSKHCYRIPTIIRTAKGTLLAFAEEREPSCTDGGIHNIVVKRSEDDGKKWGPIITVYRGKDSLSNPMPVEVDLHGRRGRDGKAVLLHFDTHNNPDWGRGHHGINLQTWSYDDGKTWSRVEEITHFMPDDRPGCLHGPSVGYQDPTTGKIWMNCHGGGTTWLYSSEVPTTSTPEYVGSPAVEAPKADTGKGMLFVSTHKVPTSGRIDGIEVYANRAEDDFYLIAYRPLGKHKYKNIGYKRVYLNEGLNTYYFGDSIGVRKGDVFGWYSEGVQPVAFSNGGETVVRRSYDYNEKTREVSMSGHDGWNRQYSIRLRIRQELADGWTLSDQTSGGETSHAPLGAGFIATARTANPRRIIKWTSHGHVTKNYKHPQLTDPGCQGSIIAVGNHHYLSNVVTTRRGDRRILTVKTSGDEGNVWDDGRVVWYGPSAYSQLVSWGSSVGILFEMGYHETQQSIRFAKWDYTHEPRRMSKTLLGGTVNLANRGSIAEDEGLVEKGIRRIVPEDANLYSNHVEGTYAQMDDVSCRRQKIKTERNGVMRTYKTFNFAKAKAKCEELGVECVGVMDSGCDGKGKYTLCKKSDKPLRSKPGTCIHIKEN